MSLIQSLGMWILNLLGSSDLIPLPVELSSLLSHVVYSALVFPFLHFSETFFLTKIIPSLCSFLNSRIDTLLIVLPSYMLCVILSWTDHISELLCTGSNLCTHLWGIREQPSCDRWQTSPQVGAGMGSWRQHLNPRWWGKKTLPVWRWG